MLTRLWRRMASVTTRNERLLLLFMCALLIGVAHFRSPFDGPYYLDVDIASSTNGTVQLFFDRGQGFRESDSVSLPLKESKTPARYRFPLIGQNFYGFRLDPNDRPGTYSITDAQFTGRDGSRNQRLPISDFNPLQQLHSMSGPLRSLTVVAPPGSNDPAIAITLRRPLVPTASSLVWSAGSYIATLLSGWLSLRWALSHIVTSKFTGTSLNWLLASGRRSVLFSRALLSRLVFMTLIAASPIVAASSYVLMYRASVFTFELQMESSVNGVVELYFNSGRGIRAEDSRQQPLMKSSVPVTYRFRLASGIYKGFRLDPNNAPGTFVVSGARIVNAKGLTQQTIDLESFEAAHQIQALEMAGSTLTIVAAPPSNDPFVNIQLAAPIILGMQFTTVPWSGLILSLLVPWGAAYLLHAWMTHGIRSQRKLVAFMQARPLRAIAVAGLAAAVVSCYPVVFLGKSFVSPANGGVSQLNGWVNALAPKGEDHSEAVEYTRYSDVGAMMWEFRPYSTIQHTAFFTDHEFPLWNRYADTGVTLFGQGISMIGDPLHLVTVIANGSALSWDFKFVAAKVLFSIGIGMLVFNITQCTTSGLLLAASSPFIGFFLLRLNHPAYFTMCYAPWILVGWSCMTRLNGRRRASPFIALIALASIMCLNSGAIKEAVMQIAFLNLTGALAFVATPSHLTPPLRRVALSGSIALVLVLISTPFWLILKDTLDTAVTVYDVPQVMTFAGYVFAGFFDEIFFTQSNSYGSVLGPSVNVFIGALALLCLTTLKNLLQEPWVWAALTCAVVTGVTAFGLVPHGLILSIPFVNRIYHIHNSFGCVLVVASMALAGFGAREFIRLSRSGTLRIYVLTTTAMGLSILALYVWNMVRISQFPDGFTPASWLFAIGPLVAIAILSASAHSLSVGRVSFPVVSLALLAFFVIHARFGQHPETGIANVDLQIFNPQYRPDFSLASKAVSKVSASTDPYRVVGVDGILFPGYNTALRLESLNGPSPLMPPRYNELMDALGYTIVPNTGWMRFPTTDTISRLGKTLDMLNVKYILGSTDLAVVPGTREVINEDLLLLERPSAWPRAYFTDTLTVYRGAAELSAQVVASEQPIAAVEFGEAGVPRPVTGAGSVVPARNYKLTTNRTRFQIDAPGAGVVVLSESYEPGAFVATLNGAPTQWFRVNHSFKGVHIPSAGTYDIEFEYRPRHWYLSLWLAGAGLVLLLGLCVLPANTNSKAGNHHYAF
jgi:hypothetical protein